MTVDGQDYARIVKYSKGFALQKGKLAGFLDLSDNDEYSGEESVEEDDEDDEEEAAQPAKPPPVKKAAPPPKKKAQHEKLVAPQPVSLPQRWVSLRASASTPRKTKRYA